MRTILRTALAAALTVLAPGAARAAPAPKTETALLGTYGFGRAAVIGRAGVQAGVWTSFSVRSGFGGDDLTVTYRPRTRPAKAETQVYTATSTTVADPSAECAKVGADGVARRVWVSYRCRTGIAPNYTLLVR